MYDSAKWRIQGRAPLIFRPNWGQKGQKIFFGDYPPPPSPYLRIWMTHLELGFFPSFHLMQKTYHVILLQKTHLVISMSPLFKLRYSAVTVPSDCCTEKNNLLLLVHVSRRGKPCVHVCNILTHATIACSWLSDGGDGTRLSISVSWVLSKVENLEETYNQLKIMIIYQVGKNQITTNYRHTVYM